MTREQIIEIVERVNKHNYCDVRGFPIAPAEKIAQEILKQQQHEGEFLKWGEMQILIPILQDREQQETFERYLSKNQFTFGPNKSGRTTTGLRVTILSAEDAFWIGANYVAISTKMFDGPLTKTGA